MAEQVTMPKLGMTMESGTILRWYVDEGVHVAKGDPLVEVMTDKINLDVESPKEGTVLRILAGVNTEVPVHQPICIIGREGETLPGGVPEEPKGSVGSRPAQSSSNKVLPEVTSETDVRLDKFRATPAARRRARELGITLSELSRQVGGRRVYAADVEHYHQTVTREETASSVSVPPPPLDIATETKAVSAGKAEAVIPYVGMRKTIGDRMQQSIREAPHVTIWTDVRMHRCADLKARITSPAQHWYGAKVTYTDIIVKAVGIALKNHPEMNRSLIGNEIVQREEVHVGVAVALPHGLVVPVLRHVDRLSLGEIARQSRMLVDRVRGGKLAPEDVSDGSFTVSNLGQYEINGFTPIINPPQAGILGVGRVRDEVVAEGADVMVLPLVTLSLSFDHRVIDGAPAAEFLQTVKHLLEDPDALIV